MPGWRYSPRPARGGLRRTFYEDVDDVEITDSPDRGWLGHLVVVGLPYHSAGSHARFHLGGILANGDARADQFHRAPRGPAADGDASRESQHAGAIHRDPGGSTGV